MRIALAGILAIVGLWSLSHSLAVVLAARDVRAAHRLAPGDGRIAAKLAMVLAGSNATEGDRRHADALARGALRHDPTAVSAVTALGLNAEIRGDRAKARELFGYAQTLSRRDVVTQLWFIENAVANGDVVGALKHYDIALLTSPEMADVLFPVLAAASADPAVRKPLAHMLAAKPLWAEAFIDHLAGKSPDPSATANLFNELRRAGVPVSDSARASVVNALAAAGDADAAWRYYAAGHPGISRDTSRDPFFQDEPESPSKLDWNLIDTPGVSVSIQRDGQNGVLEFSLPASIGGALLQQMQMLPPGNYRLVGRADGIEQPDGQRPYWILNCHDGRELGRVEMPKSSQFNGRFAGHLKVPTGCGIQTLALMARPSDAISGISGRIYQTRLEPAR